MVAQKKEHTHTNKRLKKPSVRLPNFFPDLLSLCIFFKKLYSFSFLFFFFLIFLYS